ncbi:MAG: HAD family hydrolase [Acidobacteria bacterium]|nr:HAD family hydrolase [Acidobacteriota bacterium]
MVLCRAIIFDLDGTLIDSYGPIAASLNAARAAFGLPALDVEQVRRMVGHGLEKLIEQHLGAANIPEGVRIFRENYARLYRDGTRVLPGAREVVATLAQRGFALAVASNKPARFTREIVRHVGLDGEIRVVLGPDDETPPKPDPAILTRACAELGVTADETVYVGDMPLDVESAARAGLRHFLVPTGSASLEELRATPGAHVLGTLRELADNIDLLSPSPRR